MSCHEVGRAINNVVREIMKLYDAGEISRDAAKKLVLRCAESVGWCDGNRSEPLYSIWSVSREVPDAYHIKDENGEERRWTDFVRNALT